ncbi:hypothetical protein BpHYR1_038789 [Brachionus plicatilis]|uniref:Uncharacterized protein n=1 Tax=Brachionus plicatilis TaxID=10195 RepID=A0A3M7SZL1_BRAPC|nr:hypothetical protein BpHYR1_038789 [Brachionus plicatilis]
MWLLLLNTGSTKSELKLEIVKSPKKGQMTPILPILHPKHLKVYFLSQPKPFFSQIQLNNIYLLWHNQNDTKIYSFHILWNHLSKHLNKLDKNNI